jgi:hypothetical protein
MTGRLTYDPLSPCLKCRLPLGIMQAVARGCHQACYRKLAYAVRAGETTWKKLIAEGVCTAATDVATRSRQTPKRKANS